MFDAEHLELECILQRQPCPSGGGSQAGLRLSLGEKECTPPAGKKDYIVPISGKATAKGERGAGGEWKGACLTQQVTIKILNKKSLHGPDLNLCEPQVQTKAMCWVKLAFCWMIKVEIVFANHSMKNHKTIKIGLFEGHLLDIRMSDTIINKISYYLI